MCEYKNDMTLRQYKRKHLHFSSNIGVHAWTELFSLESTYILPPEFADRQNGFLSRIKHIIFECVFGMVKEMETDKDNNGSWGMWWGEMSASRGKRESAGGEETVELKI